MWGKAAINEDKCQQDHDYHPQYNLSVEQFVGVRCLQLLNLIPVAYWGAEDVATDSINIMMW
jgi:hypothetical protein